MSCKIFSCGWLLHINEKIIFQAKKSYLLNAYKNILKSYYISITFVRFYQYLISATKNALQKLKYGDYDSSKMEIFFTRITYIKNTFSMSIEYGTQLQITWNFT